MQSAWKQRGKSVFLVFLSVFSVFFSVFSVFSVCFVKRVRKVRGKCVEIAWKERVFSGF